MIDKKSPASEAIELLIDLAQKGEINPWDVQVIDVIDRFLDELELDNLEAINNKKANLPQSGQVILWASMLVLLKADTLEKLAQEEDEIEEDFELELIDNLSNGNDYSINNLDKQIRRRTSAVPPKKRRVTLPEFIKQLQEIAEEIEKFTNGKSNHLTNNNRRSKKETINAINKLAHNENLTELAKDLDSFFRQDLPLLSPEMKAIDLEMLLNFWAERNEQKTKDRVGVFWALLLLSSQSKVELSQNEFYQELKINII